MAIDDGYVLPKPGIPKTLGILSVIFSVILILVGFCGIAGTLLAPVFTQFADTAIKEAQKKVESDQKAQVSALDEREKAAKTDEEKAAIKAERDALAAQPKAPKVDMTAVTGMITDPTVAAYSFVELGTGLALHITLLIAGIGLIRLTPWGRSLGIYWSGIQIAQILILAVVSFLYIQPKAMAVQEKILAQAEAEEKAGGQPNPGLAGLKMARSMQGFNGVLLAGKAVVGCVFPTVMLILLGGSGAKAACRGAKLANPGLGEL